MKLSESVGVMHRLLRGSLEPARAAELLEASTDRLTAYRGFVRNHVRLYLEKNYVVLHQILQPDVWEVLFERSFHRCPSREYELNANAEGFLEVLSEAIAEGDLGLSQFHHELAQLEWLEWVVYADRVEMPAPVTIERVAINPSLQLLSTEWPVASFVRSWRMGEAPEIPDVPQPEIVFVYRDPLHGWSRLIVADDALLFAFKLVHDGLKPSEAAQLTGLKEVELFSILQSAVETGILVAPQSMQRLPKT